MNNNFSFRRLNAIIVKEFIHIIRDWRSLTLAIAIPVMLLALFGYALNMDLKNIPIYVIDRSATPESRALTAMFDGSPYFSVRSYAVNERQIEDGIKSRKIKAGVVISSDFAKRLHNGTYNNILVIIDGSDANTGRLIMNYSAALGVIYNEKLAVKSASLGGLSIAPRAWYNQQMNSTYNLVPGITAIVMVVIASMLASVTVAKEWEMGTMEQLISTPVRKLEMTLGKAIPLYIVGLLDVLLATVMGMLIFKVPLRGDPLLLILVATIFLTGVLFFGLFLSIALKNQVLANQIALLSGFLPTLILSGFVFTIENMPVAIQVITHIFPARYFIAILRAIYLKGVGLDMVLYSFAFLSGYAVLMILLANKKLQLRLD